jgi:hypothetical protein
LKNVELLLVVWLVGCDAADFNVVGDPEMVS